MNNQIQGAEKLEDLIQYQTGSIVSRVMLKEKNGNVTLFAFSRGEELTEHTSPFTALILGVQGEGEVKIAGTPNTVKAGMIITLPANIPHAVRAVEDFKMLLIMVKG